MRLGQLARKLALTPSEITTFLKERGIDLEAGANTRLQDEYVVEIVRHFAPTRINEIVNDVDPIEAEAAPTASLPIAEPPAESADQTVEQPDPTLASDIPALNEIDPTEEVIRAPKVELQGLKVIGKIDLPEPKKKTSTESDTPVNPGEEEEPKPINQGRKPLKQRTEGKDSRPWKNTLATKREQEQREREKKRKEDAELAKERRTQNYLKKVKSVPTKAVRRFEDPVIEMTDDVADEPTSWWGKFKRWLTT